MSKKKVVNKQLPEPSFEKVLVWLKALKSGEYRKGYASLHEPSDCSYCCLGVALKTIGKEDRELFDRSYMSDEEASLFGLTYDTQEFVSRMNDIDYQRDVDFQNVLNNLLNNPDRYFVEGIAKEIKEAHERGDI